MDHIVELALSNAVSAAFMALLVVLLTLRVRRPAVVYALWMAVLLRLLAPPALEIALLPTAEPSRATASTAAATDDLVAVAPAGAPHVRSFSPRTAALGVWTGGIVAAIAVAAVRGLRLRRLLATARPLSDDLARRLGALSRQIGLRTPPRSLSVPITVPPMLWSLLGTTRLILPTELMEKLSPAETDALLAHELAHLRRRDHWARHLELVAGSIFWWHPVAWWATRCVRHSQELCCDRTVARLLPDHRRAYASCLVKTADFLSSASRRPAIAASGMADLQHLKGRITMIMSGSRDRALSLPSRVVVTTTLFLSLALTPMLTARPASTELGPQFTGDPISLHLADAELLSVLDSFSKLTGLEIFVEPAVDVKVSIDVERTPRDEVLHQILRGNGLEYSLDDGRLIVRRGSQSTMEEVKTEPADPRVVGRVNGQDVYRFLEIDRMTAPVRASGSDPAFPDEEKHQRFAGKVVVECLIDATGTVRDVNVLQSPSHGFTTSTIDAVSDWLFEPATLDGVPVAVRYVMVVSFRLE